MTEGSRRSRWWGLAGVAARRAVARSAKTDRVQTWLSVAGVAVAVALLLLVTSVGVALAGQDSLHGGDYAIVPDDGPSSVIADVDSARLGRVHDVSAELSGRDDVAAATPVRTDAVRVRAGGETGYLLLVGVVRSSSSPSIAGLPTEPLAPGDPHYANGTYEGTWTGEAVLSESGADALNATAGDRLVPTSGSGDRSFSVAAVRAPDRAGIGQFPVAVVHLSELQALAGGTEADAADQIVVDAEPGAESALEGVYPRSSVVSRGDLLDSGDGSELPVAIAVAAFVIAVAVGTLFTATTLGFELAAGSTERAVMAALGLSRRSRAALVAARVLFVATLGGLAGILLWFVGVITVNAVATTFVTELPVATFRPALAGYGLAVALLIGVLALPYLLFVSYRTAERGDPLP